MPSRPSTWCINGCKVKAVKGSNCCTVCVSLASDAEQQRRMRHDIKRGTARQRGYDWQWQKTRKVVLAQEPVCRMCRNAVASMVDHITPIRDGGERLAYENLQPLCNACHVVKTKQDMRNRLRSEAMTTP